MTLDRLLWTTTHRLRTAVVVLSSGKSMSKVRIDSHAGLLGIGVAGLFSDAVRRWGEL
jgi:hypothetical protein